MPGSGTFNLSELFRQMGFKSQDPSLTQRVSPVVVVGDMKAWTPRHAPPTFMGGGSVNGVALQFGIVQVVSRASGGTVLAHSNIANANHAFGLVAAPIAGFAAVPDFGPLSFDASVVQVSQGNQVADPLGANPPLLRGNMVNSPLDWFFIPPGRVLIIRSAAVGVGIGNFFLVLQDVVPLEIPAA